MAVPALEFESVSFTYPGAPQPAIENVSLRVEQGERLGILGPNGGGKSTLLKIALGMLSGHRGVVRVLGGEPAAARQAGMIGYVPQRSEIELGMPISVRQFVTLAGAWRASPLAGAPAPVRSHVAELLDLVGCAAFAEKPVGALSGGQLQRALIARALAAKPSLLVLDEPTVGIDAAGQAKLAELLGSLHDRLRITTITVSHDLRAIAASSDRVACLARRLHLHAAPQGLTPAVLAELFSHDIAGITGLEGMHLHAHGAGEPCPAPTAAITISAKPREGGSGA